MVLQFSCRMCMDLVDDVLVFACRIANAAAAAVGLDDSNNRHLITASYDDL